MKKKTHASESNSASSDYIQERARSLMREIKSALEAHQGRDIPLEELARYSGQTISPVFDKFQKTHQPQIEALLGWLERLPDAARAQVVGKACRIYPTLDSPRFSADPTMISHLRTLLRRSVGFTVIQGGNDGLRTFVVTALAHSRAILHPDAREAFGLDVHEPDWFVPVDNVVYLRNLLDGVTLREQVYQQWPNLSRMKGRMVILNGVWSVMQPMEREIMDLGAQSHVWVADEPRFKLETVAPRGGKPAHLLTISEDRDRIRVSVQQL